VSYVDLHSHVLPGLDDGARDLRDSLAMIAGLRELGFAEIYATPHQKAPVHLPTREAIRAAHDVLTGALGEGDGVTIGLAAENHWDSVFFERLTDRSFPTYTPDHKAFLIEFAADRLAPGADEHLFRLRVGGLLPAIAHPERYADIARDLGRAEALGRTAALVVDLGALGGTHDRRANACARALCERGLAHAAASDVHRPSDLDGAAKGIAWIRKHLGADALTRLLDRGPRAILAGEMPAP
jgi:protein-tyrosine phosphatase